MTLSNISSPPANWRTYLGSAVLLTWMTLSTLLTAPIVFLCAPLPFMIRYRIACGWAGAVLKMAEWCCGVSYKIEGHIPTDQPLVVLSNHQSAWETIAYRYILPPQTSLFKRSLLWLPVWGWALALLKPIAIDRNNKTAALRKLISHGTAALQEGLWVIVFPEGTRKPVGEMGEFSAGGALLAQKSGFPVLPIAHNAGRCWPRYSFLKYPGTITVKIGPLISSENCKASEINQRAENWVAEALQSMTGDRTV